MPTKRTPTGTARKAQKSEGPGAKNNLEAANSLIQEIGELIGVDVEDEITPHNVVSYTAQFVAALSTGGPTRTGGLAGGGLDSFDERDLDTEIDRANAQGPGRALQRRQDAADDRAHGQPNRAASFIDGIAEELGLDLTGMIAADALAAIYQEIQRIKNPATDVDAAGPLSKGDTLAQAIQHNARQRTHLDAELTRNRKIVGNIAGAMQISVTDIDADGSQLVERIQRWETFKHILTRRIRELLTGEKTPTDDQNVAIAEELQTLLSLIMSSQEFVKWQRGKPARVVKPAVASLGNVEPTQATFPAFTAKASLQLTSLVVSGSVAPGADTPEARYVAEIVTKMSASNAATEEFVRLMNLVILPILARLNSGIGMTSGLPIETSGDLYTKT